MIELLKGKELLLASKSPRRKELLEKSLIPFTLITADWEESYDPEMSAHDVPQYLSYHKAEHIKDQLKPNQILLTADTVVILENEVVGKPKNREDAIRTIEMLSANTHEVVTGITLMSLEKTVNASCLSVVDFMPLTKSEIESYVDQFEPFDKAGSYGIQDWIGFVKIQSINGSYHNIMGLPTHMVYEILRIW